MYLYLFLYSSILLILIIIIKFFINYKIQILLRRKKIKKDIIDKLNKFFQSKYYPEGYYSNSHRIILPGEYKGFSYRHQSNFSHCFNILKIKIKDAEIEIFFSLIKEGIKYYEILNLRIFPRHHIKYESHIEKNHSHLNIYTNNQYFTNTLNNSHIKYIINSLLISNGDSLILLRNNLHLKIFYNKKNITAKKILQLTNLLIDLSKEIYKENQLYNI